MRMRRPAGLVLVVLAMAMPARADIATVTERGIRLCETGGCWQIMLIEIVDHLSASVGTPGPLNPTVARGDEVRIDIGTWNPDEHAFTDPVTYRGTLDPPDGAIVWDSPGGGGRYRGTVRNDQGATCDLWVSWSSTASDAGEVTYRADTDGAAVERRGTWPVAFYAFSQSCGLGGSSAPDPAGWEWEERALSA